MSKVLLVLSFVALSLSGAWASSSQDDDLIDFELVLLTSDGESWVGASGAKIKYADSKAISAWRREQERGGDRTALAAVEAIGESVESGPDGSATLRIPDKRISISCELDGVVTHETFSTRAVREGRAEVQLKNGFLEMQWASGFNEMKASAESYITFQLVGEDGAPLSHAHAQGLAFFRHKDAPVVDHEVSPRVILGRAIGAPHVTNSRGEGFIGLYSKGVVPHEAGHVFLSSSEHRPLVEMYAELDQFAVTELHVRAFAQGSYEFMPEIMTTRQIIPGPLRIGANDFGAVLVSRPPVLAAGVVLDATGQPIEGAVFSLPVLEVGGSRLRPHLPKESFGRSGSWTPHAFHQSLSMWAVGQEFASIPSRVPPEVVFDVMEPHGGVTGADGRFEIRGRVFPDSICAEVPTKTSSEDWLHEDVESLGGTVSLTFDGSGRIMTWQGYDSSEAFEWSGPLGSEDNQVRMARSIELFGNVLLPENFPSCAILIHARKPGGALAGGAMSLDAQGNIEMHSAPHIRIGDPRLWSNASYGGITYDESVPAEIEPGTWDVCFELKGERDWDDPAPFHVIPAVEFSTEGVTEDTRLKDVDFRETLGMSVLAIQGADGEPIPEALVRCKPANSGREWFAGTEGGLCRILTTAKAVDVEVMAPGHRPTSMTIDLDREFEVLFVPLAEGVPVKLSIPEDLEIPLSADAAGERPTKFEITLRDTRYETGRTRGGRDESPYGRRHPDKGFGGEGINYIGTAASGGGMVISKDLALRFSGYYSEESFSCTEREFTMFVPAEGIYEVRWVVSWQEPWVEDGPNSRRSTTTQRLITTTEVDIQEGQNPSTAELDVTQAYLDARLGEIRKER